MGVEHDEIVVNGLIDFPKWLERYKEQADYSTPSPLGRQFLAEGRRYHTTPYKPAGLRGKRRDLGLRDREFTDESVTFNKHL